MSGLCEVEVFVLSLGLCSTAPGSFNRVSPFPAAFPSSGRLKDSRPQHLGLGDNSRLGCFPASSWSWPLLLIWSGALMSGPRPGCLFFDVGLQGLRRSQSSVGSLTKP